MGLSADRESVAGVDLSSQHLRIVLGLLQAHLPGVAAWAYGSRVRGNARRYSDLDLVVFTAPGQTRQLDGLREAFEESDLPFRVDLFAWRETPKSFHQQIKREYAVLQQGAGEPADCSE